MRIYYDVDRNQLLHLADPSRPVRNLEYKRGDAQQVTLSFHRDEAAAALTNPSDMRLVVKAEYADTATVLLMAHEWVYDGTGDTYSAPLVGDASLEELIGEADYLDLKGEFTYTDALGGPNTSQTIIFRVHNDVWKGSESTPLALPTPEEWLAARAVTTITRTAYQGTPGNVVAEVRATGGIDFTGAATEGDTLTLSRGGRHGSLYLHHHAGSRY